MRAFALGVAVLVCAAAPASAATVSVERTDRNDFGTATLRAADGEHNDVRVSGGDGRVTFRDSGDLRAMGPECSNTDRQTVVCSGYGADVFLGDEADRASLDVGGHVDGGPGDDVLIGSEEGDGLTGGDGKDTIEGRGGIDWITGDGSRPAPDLLSGGDGRDMLRYTSHPQGVRIHLGQATSSVGAARENDVISGFEDAEGTAHHDVILGDEGSNFVHDGFGGHDRVVTLGGNDLIIGTGSFDAGDGDDEVLISNRRGKDRAVVDCGSGADRVAKPTPADVLRPGCEQWSITVGNLDDTFLPVTPSLHGRTASFGLGCPYIPPFRGSCKGILSITTDGPGRPRVIGRTRFAIPNTGRGQIKLRLNRRDAAALRSSRGLAVRVSMVIAFDEGRETAIGNSRGGYRTVLSAR